MFGGPIGASLSEDDRQAAWKAQIAALDSGQRRSWRGAHGVFGFVEPGAETGNGCRAYSQTIYVAGRPNRGQGVACKQAGRSVEDDELGFWRDLDPFCDIGARIAEGLVAKAAREAD